MQRLRGSDAFTLYAESESSPFVTLKAAIYQAADSSDIPDTGEIKRFIKESIPVVGAPRAGLRIMRVPYDLHHPVWVADPDFSPDDHIYYERLPAPGGREQLCEFLSEMMGKPLNPDRPLWEIWVVEGLENNKIAIVFKIHHALADGKTMASLIARGHSQSIEEEVGQSTVPTETVPGKLSLVGDALIDLVKSYTVEFPSYYRHLKQSRQQSAVTKDAGEETAGATPAPHTVFNEIGGCGRVYRYETFSLVEFKTLAKHFDCTVNTLVLGVCSEALKRYLGDVDALPQESLVTVMPLGDTGGGDLVRLLDSNIHNNHLSAATLPLFQNINDFEQRLQKIKRASRAAIDKVQRSRGRRFDSYLDYMPGTFIRLISASMKRRQEKKLSPFANVAISNVPGPREVLHALDGRLEMVELLSTGNLTDAMNLNITVWSYVDNLSFSFYSRKDVLAEPDKINRYVRDFVNELRSRYLADPVPPQSAIKPNHAWCSRREIF